MSAKTLGSCLVWSTLASTDFEVSGAVSSPVLRGHLPRRPCFCPTSSLLGVIRTDCLSVPGDGAASSASLQLPGWISTRGTANHHHLHRDGVTSSPFSALTERAGDSKSSISWGAFLSEAGFRVGVRRSRSLLPKAGREEHDRLHRSGGEMLQGLNVAATRHPLKGPHLLKAGLRTARQTNQDRVTE